MSSIELAGKECRRHSRRRRRVRPPESASAMTAANAADAHAADAAKPCRTRPTPLQVNAADGRTTSLNGTVSNLGSIPDRSGSTALPFVAGHTILTPQAESESRWSSRFAWQPKKATSSRSRATAGAESLRRRLWPIPSSATWSRRIRCRSTASTAPVLVPRRQPPSQATDAEPAITNGVRVTILHNSLATMGSTSTTPKATTHASPPPQGN